MRMVSRNAERLRRLLDVVGRTYADEAGIRLADRPAPLYQLQVVALLSSTRISAELAVAGARELRSAGYTTARAMRDASWQARVDALDRAHYTRYDDSTSTRLGDGAQLLLDRYRGDLRRLADAADQQVKTTSARLQEIPGIGPVGAEIFLREVQAVWTWVRPYVDQRVKDSARDLGLPVTAPALARLAGTDDLSVVGAALIRVSHDKDLRRQVVA